MNLYKKLQQTEKFFLIAGPCVIENEDLMLETVEALKNETTKRGIRFIFKSSFKKANRSSIDSPTGPGLVKGLKILEKIKSEFDTQIITDVHKIDGIKKVAEVADIIQIPAFLSRQTDLLVNAGETNKIVNIKKGQFMAPEDMKYAAEKVSSTGNKKIILTERGTCFGYHNLVVDFRGFSVMSELNFPIVYDVTHSLQQPSIGRTSGGSPEYATMMARAALATKKVKGLFIETHPNPSQAFSDAKSMLPLSKLADLLDSCLNLY